MTTLIENNRVVQRTFIGTFCTTPTFEECNVTVHCFLDDELKDYLDRYGCYDEIDDIVDLPLGKSVTIGFPQASYLGLIITRIA